MAYKLEFADAAEPRRPEFESHGVKVLVDPKSLPYIDGTELDYTREGLNEGFKFRNPKVKDECGCGESFNVLTDCTTLARPADTRYTCAEARDASLQ